MSRTLYKLKNQRQAEMFSSAKCVQIDHLVKWKEAGNEVTNGGSFSATQFRFSLTSYYIMIYMRKKWACGLALIYCLRPDLT